ncbi:DUF1904 family protein [Paenibacillus filicis]|uniref:DUF1904 family protein n=1 Tax=Paenibacillus filicis TaxID=669464 RepID=A0ABU9DQ85_9BACL
MPAMLIPISNLASAGIFNGELVPSFPFVHVWWFERGQETRDRMAQSINSHLREAGIAESEVAFSTFHASSYYDGGQHFG